MELALIAPLNMLSVQEKQRFQLLLPDLFRFSDYRSYAHSTVSNPRTYTILDNGAAEGELATNLRIAQLHQEYHFNEIVMPDVMGDPEATLKLAKVFLGQKDRLGKICTDRRYPGVKLGYVLHGDGHIGVIQTLRALKKEREVFNAIKVLYLPRVLMFKGGRNIRAILAQDIKSICYDKEIHLLGADPRNPQEVQSIGSSYPLWSSVRSMDTSLPFVWGSYGVDVRMPTTDGYTRQPGYFLKPLLPEEQAIALSNCEVMNEWSRGTQTPVSPMRVLPTS